MLPLSVFHVRNNFPQLSPPPSSPTLAPLLVFSPQADDDAYHDSGIGGGGEGGGSDQDAS